MALIFVGNEKKTSHVRGPPNDQAYTKKTNQLSQKGNTRQIIAGLDRLWA